MGRFGLAIVMGFFALGVWAGAAAVPLVQITIESESPYFLPAAATVTTGAAIRWDNPTATYHTVTHDGCLKEEGPCTFDSGPVALTGSYSLPSLPPGRYPYHCRLHPIMRGVLIVTEPAAPSRT
jgi:plastocyanin